MENKKTLAELQAEVDEYISQFKEGYFSPLAMLARLSEELGELAREVNHFYGEKPKKSIEKENTVEAELADMLFVIVCFANSLDIDLQTAHDAVMNKFNTRDKDRWTRIGKETERVDDSGEN
ncbi:nucleotide pyrophosphohydrolase [Peribacillus cavernae]|uniref:Nucleotide pyrophosphohydrolase n=1 Tax=Peribacillus cavernae TaxID=1674310 RepID=A0A433HM88_9BACI|nr:nucleotide pyrophosphohydrolase [Peribacillus cavernae]MDQ0218969.1 NTP pyrophosphatase (non-canonical NTP hydrolase) [Peribacillus cavernae]RUQ29323.1 nucleotide pyrophosphohydrolase [Peribacillus cavernae]